MKEMKCRDKYVKLLKKELEKIHSRSTVLNIRRSVRQADKYLNQILNFILHFDSEILAVQSLKVKNCYLARNLQNEKERSSRLQQEKTDLQAMFYEMHREKLELKKEKNNLEQMILLDLEEFKSTLPNIVEISEHYSKRILKYETIRKNNALRNLPRSSFGINSNQPVSTVNPMVQGHVIQKPTISVRRVHVPSETRNSMFEYVNINSPILEEDETSSPTINSTQRCENSLRSALNVSNRSTERQSCHLATETNYCDDAVDDDEQSNVHLEPVVRLEDVTRLLQNSSIRLSESPKASPGKFNVRLKEADELWSPEVLVPKISIPMRRIIVSSDNPLEGCSWMQPVTPSPNVLNHTRQLSPDQNKTYTHPKKSYCSPMLPKSPLCCKRNSGGLNSLNCPGTPAESKLDENLDLLDDAEDTGVVSSSNMDDSEDVFRVGITHRRQKKRERTRIRYSSNSSETDENSAQNNESTQRILRSRKSSRPSVFISTSSETDENSAQNNESTQRILRSRKSSRPLNLSENLTSTPTAGNTTENTEKDEMSDFEVSRAPQLRKKRKANDSKRDNVSNVSNSDFEDSSYQSSRPTRNRGNVSLKEPSLRSKLRRK